MSVNVGRSYCASYPFTISREGLIGAAKLGQAAGHSPEARACQAKKERRDTAEMKAWNFSDQPDWLTDGVHRESMASVRPVSRTNILNQYCL